MGRFEWPAPTERESELEAIDAAVAGVEEGSEMFLLLDGRPGIGKSALLGELTDSLQLTANHKVSTQANWKQDEDVIIAGSVSDE